MTAESPRKLTKGTVQQAETMVADAANAVAGRAMTAVRDAGAAAESLYDQSADAREYVVRAVLDNPLPALLVAGALGYAVACLVHRR